MCVAVKAQLAILLTDLLGNINFLYVQRNVAWELPLSPARPKALVPAVGQRHTPEGIKSIFIWETDEELQLGTSEWAESSTQRHCMYSNLEKNHSLYLVAGLFTCVERVKLHLHIQSAAQ